MRRQAIIGALLAAGGLTAPTSWTSAQEPGVVHLERGPDRLMRIMLDRRARLGIKVNLQARQTDSIGAYVDAVTPGGPAAQAGIRSGDVITRVNGKSVLAGGAAEGEDLRSRQSLPGLRLIELAARLEPNDTVAVEYRRGKDRRTASVVTAEEPEMAFGPGEGDRFGFRFMGPGGPGGPGAGRLPVGEFLERIETSRPPLGVSERLAARPPGAGAPQLRPGAVLRHRRGGAGDQRAQGLRAGAPRRGCRADGGRPRPVEPLSPAPHLAQL